MKHFTLTSNSKVNRYGFTLYQIRYNATGELGGWVENEDCIKSNKAFIYNDAEIFASGVMRGGVMHGGVMHGGVMWGGVMWGGVMHGGVMWGGVMWGGVMHGGEMHGGVMRGGEMHGGVMHGGVMQGGEMWGGEMRGGVMRGGVMRGGVMRGGVMWGGEWETAPMQIQGSRHFVNVCAPHMLKIGCKEYSFEWWKKNFDDVGEKEGYSKDERKEYIVYIDAAISIYGLSL